MGNLEEADERFCVMAEQEDVSEDKALKYIEKKYGFLTARLIKEKYEGKEND